MIDGLALFDAERTWAAEEATIAAAEAGTNNDQIAVFFALAGGRS
jgi:outer membrane protein TolC